MGFVSMRAGRRRRKSQGACNEIKATRGCLTGRDLSVIVTVYADACQQTCSLWAPYVQEGSNIRNAAGAQSSAA
jgi:hypothetical protein